MILWGPAATKPDQQVVTLAKLDFPERGGLEQLLRIHPKLLRFATISAMSDHIAPQRSQWQHRPEWPLIPGLLICFSALSKIGDQTLDPLVISGPISENVARSNLTKRNNFNVVFKVNQAPEF